MPTPSSSSSIDSSSSSSIDSSSSSSIDSSSSSIDSSSSSSIDSSSSSSSSLFDNHDKKTLPFGFVIDKNESVWDLALHGRDAYAGTGPEGVVLKSSNRDFWGKFYQTDDIHVTSLLASGNKLYVGTSPKGYLYVIDLSDNSLESSNIVNKSIVSIVAFKGNIYAGGERSVYAYDTIHAKWDVVYEPYGPVNEMKVLNDKLYIAMQAENLISFDGVIWALEDADPNNFSSHRTSGKEPFSQVSKNLLDRASVSDVEIQNYDNEDIRNIFPQNYVRGISSITADGNFILLGSSNYGRVFAYNQNANNKISLLFQTASKVHSLLNIDTNVSLAGIDNNLYLIHCFDEESEETEPSLTSATTVESSNSVVTLVSPNGGEEVEIGEAVTITWTSTQSLNDAVSIDLYRGEELSQQIIAKTSNDGEFEWLVPLSVIIANDYRIKITWLSAGTPADSDIDFSDSTFSFVAAASTTTTTTTVVSTIDSLPEFCRGITILELSNEDEYITDIVLDNAFGGILLSTSEGRILSAASTVINSNLAGTRKVYAEVTDGFSRSSNLTGLDIFYGLQKRIVHINEDKEIIKWKFVEDPSAILTDRITGIFLSPIMNVKEDLGFWKELIWTEDKPVNTEIIICLRAADTIEELEKRGFDHCFVSSNEYLSNGVISRTLNSLDIKGQYIQIKITMTTNLQNVTPTVINTTLTYSTAFAIFFFTTKFSLENDSDLQRGLLTGCITEPQNTIVKFGVVSSNSADWNDYTVIDPDKLFDIKDFENIKIGIKMISYGDNFPEVASFALMAGGNKENLINK